MINTLYISHSGELGGAEIALVTLLRHLDRNTFNPLVILPRQGYLASELEKLAVSCQFLEIPWWLRAPGTVAPSSCLGSSWSGEVTELEPAELMRLTETALQERLDRLTAIIRNNGVQIVHTNTLPILEGALAARLTGVKHIWHLHEVDAGHPGLLPRLPARARYWLLGALSDLVVASSPYLFKSFGPHVASDRLQLINNGVETEFGHLGFGDPEREELRRQCRQELGMGPHHQIICSVGHADPVKGWPDLVATASLLTSKRDEVRFVVVGDTQRAGFSEIQRQVRRLGLADKIIFTGPRMDVQRIMLASEVIFQPSLWESLSIVLLEGTAMSLPLVATRCGGTEEVIRDRETGFLVPIGDIPEMAKALTILLDDPELRRQFGEAGRRVYLEKFTPQQYADEFMKLYWGLANPDKPTNALNQPEVSALASLYAALLGSVMQGEHARQQLKDSRQQLKDIFASRSYRIMEPLRRLKRRLG